jgi:hypothetical protein
VRPIIFRCQNAVVVFIPFRAPRGSRFGVSCLNDNSQIVANRATPAQLRSLLSGMAQKAIALGGAIQQIVQLEL